MAKTIHDLRSLLREVDGNVTVYIQPPGDESLEYPCIIIDREPGDDRFADDSRYLHFKKYTFTYMYYDIDDVNVDKYLELPMTSLDRHFKSDNIYHTTYTIYY